MAFSLRTAAAAAALFAAGVALAGCQTPMRIAPDFGQALRQDLAAQVADPDAAYKGTPNPGYDGERAWNAQTRYRTGQVVPPAVSSTGGLAPVAGPPAAPPPPAAPAG